MLMHTNLGVQVEGNWRILIPERMGRGVWKIGDYLYDEGFKAVTPGAPDVLEPRDLHSNIKQHTKGRRQWLETMRQLELEAKQRDAERNTAEFKQTRLNDVDQNLYVRAKCVNPDCGRDRMDRVWRLCREARLGDRTFADLERVYRCMKCQGEARISVVE